VNSTLVCSNVSGLMVLHQVLFESAVGISMLSSFEQAKSVAVAIMIALKISFLIV
jgi:hypothetical protein